jgi:hypothetical protein
MDAGAQFAGHIRNDVHDMAVAFYGELIRHGDAADFSRAPNVVSSKVEKHEVFGALFRIGQ